MNANQEKQIRKLLEHPDLLGELAPRTQGDPKIKAALGALDLGSGDMVACLRSALYLRFNFLDESHKISQGINSSEGSYWHAIMHRREPDYRNAKYWYRRVGTHPVLGRLPGSDPFAFVDFCEQAEHDKAKYERAIELQRAEWQALFEHCLRAAQKS
jgi:hypothetical protein